MLNVLRKYVKDTKEDWNYITPTDFYKQYFSKKSMKNDYITIDLRKKEDYKQFHMPGSINIFWMDLLKTRNLNRIIKYQQQVKKIFLICYVGHTSSQAMTLLRILGIPVTSIKFGYGLSPLSNVPIAGWLQYHYPLSCKN
jgi:rhodanese-related sulfurtransferase